MPGDKLRELTERLGGEHRRSFMQSLRDAADGLRIALTERNMRIHVCFMVLVTVLGLVVGLTNVEWAGLLLVIGMVIRDEIKNSAIERLVDLHSPLRPPTPDEIFQRAREAKHLAAASVLWGAITSVLCGMIIILPRMLA